MRPEIGARRIVAVAQLKAESAVTEPQGVAVETFAPEMPAVMSETGMVTGLNVMLQTVTQLAAEMTPP